MELLKRILDLTKDLTKTYRNAPYELKRLYLGLFWAKFEVKGRVIVTAMPSEMLEMLIGVGSISIKGIAKNIPVKSMFLLKEAYLNEGIRIKPLVGA